MLTRMHEVKDHLISVRKVAAILAHQANITSSQKSASIAMVVPVLRVITSFSNGKY